MGSTGTVLCTLFMFIIGIGVGIGIGYGVFNKKTETTTIASTQSTSVTTDKTTTTSGSTTITSPSSSSTITSLSQTTTTTSTAEEILPVAICPPILTSPYTIRQLVLLNQTATSNSFEKFSYAFVTPTDVSQAMIIFHFITEWGSWYLDDVSIQSPYNPSNNLIDNGGFESSNLGSRWKFCDTRFSWLTEGTVVSHTHNFGIYSYESLQLDSGSDEYLTQVFNIESLREYDIQFYLAFDGSVTSATVSIMMR